MSPPTDSDGVYHWGGFACAVVVLVVAWLGSLYKLRRIEPPPSITSVARSRFGWFSPKVLCGIRGALALYIFILAADSLSKPSHDGKELWIFYYTAWNWLILGIYFGLTSAASYLWLRRPEAAVWENPDGSVRFGALTRACSILCSLNAANILMVDISVWGVLFPLGDATTRQAYLSFDSLNRHAANFFMMSFELLVGDMPICQSHVFVVIFFVATYGAFTISRILLVADTAPCVAIACEKNVNGYLVWPYFFLNTSTPLAGVEYLGLLLAEVLFFSLSSLCRQAFSKCFGRRKQDLLDVGTLDPREVSRAIQGYNECYAQWVPHMTTSMASPGTTPVVPQQQQ